MSFWTRLRKSVYLTHEEWEGVSRTLDELRKIEKEREKRNLNIKKQQREK
jgi:hypothetical protein